MAKIKIINTTDIDFGNEKELENKIERYSNLPECRINLIFLNKDLPYPDYQGVFVSKDLIKCERKSSEYLNIGTDPKGTGNTPDFKWDCYVAISKKWCDKRNEYPAFFKFLIGHELGHAKIYLSDENLHIHSCLIKGCIECASNGRIKPSGELPHEILCDKFGKYFSHQFYDEPKKLEDEIDKLIINSDCEDSKNFSLIKNVKPTNNFEGLKESLIKFSMPYKEKLIKLWEKSVEINGEYSLASKIGDYETLFQST